MAKNNTSFSGFDELMQNLQQLEKLSTKRAVIRRSIDKAVKPMAEQMRQRAPKADGELQDSIKISGQLNKSQMALWKKENPSKSAVTRFVGSTAAHAVSQEYGTSPHENKGKFAGTMHPGTAPQPFGRPSFNSTADQVWNTLADEMEKEIIKTVKRVNARKNKK